MRDVVSSSAMAGLKAILSFSLHARIAALAMGAILAYRLRSAFIIAGVALGVAALTIIVASVDGAQKKARQVVEWFGPDAAFVIGGDIQNRPVGQRTLTISWTDAKTIAQSLPGAYLVVPMRSKSDVTVKTRERSAPVAVAVGSTGNYALAWNWPLNEGRDLSDDDIEHSAKVCLMGYDPATALFPERSPVGQIVTVNDIPFQVVGTLSYRGLVGGGHSPDDRIIMPITTLTQRFHLDRKYFRALRVKFLEPERMDEHTANLRAILRHLHGLKNDDPDDFSIITANEILKFLAMLQGSLVIFLGLTAVVAMMVSGFILANLISLSVEERHAEIGLKKALGANPRHILFQFLSEAVVLTCCGSVLGLALGIAMGQLLTKLDIIPIDFSWKLFAMAVCAALVIGIVFGLKPARHAAKLDPIRALQGN